MPKLKTHKGAAARFKITGSGKFLRRKGSVNNYRRKKALRAKGQFDEMIAVHKSRNHGLRKLLPYGRQGR
jgi:large subunit ribosomal protein L35